MTIKALVTGANGFIGSHLVDRLLKEEVQVTVLVRAGSNLRWLQDKAVTMIKGDLTDADSLASGVKGQDYIFHVAALIRAVNRQPFYEVNVKGTENLLQAVIDNQVDLKKFIFISSLEAAGPSSGGVAVKENDQAHPVTDYGRSKLQAEELLQNYGDQIPYGIIRPPVVYGPRDPAFYQFFKQVRRHLILNIGLQAQSVSCVYIENLVEAVWLSANNDARSTMYHVCDPETPGSLIEMQFQIARIMGIKRCLVCRIPCGAFWLLCLGGEIWQKITRCPLWISLVRYKTYSQPVWRCDAEKISEELGYQPLCSREEGSQT